MPDELNDPLDQLFVKEKNLSDRKLLAEALLPYATIYVSDGGEYEVSLTTKGQDMPTWKRLLVFFLAHKAIAIKAESESVKEAQTPKQLEEETDIAGGTLRPTLKKLSDEKFVQQDSTGAYFLPNRNVRRARDVLVEGEQS